LEKQHATDSTLRVQLDALQASLSGSQMINNQLRASVTDMEERLRVREQKAPVPRQQ
jgi:hypothetical protein